VDARRDDAATQKLVPEDSDKKAARSGVVGLAPVNNEPRRPVAPRRIVFHQNDGDDCICCNRDHNIDRLRRHNTGEYTAKFHCNAGLLILRVCCSRVIAMTVVMMIRMFPASGDGGRRCERWRAVRGKRCSDEACDEKSQC
jgi:hypothetical protein